jgi:hypothetical protein
VSKRFFRMALSLDTDRENRHVPFFEDCPSCDFFPSCAFFLSSTSAMSRRQVSCAAVPPGDPFRSRIRTFSD